MVMSNATQSYDNPRNVNSVVDIAEDIAELSGIFKNTSYLRNFPLLWRMVTWYVDVASSVC